MYQYNNYKKMLLMLICITSLSLHATQNNAQYWVGYSTAMTVTFGLTALIAAPHVYQMANLLKETSDIEKQKNNSRMQYYQRQFQHNNELLLLSEVAQKPFHSADSPLSRRSLSHVPCAERNDLSSDLYRSIKPYLDTSERDKNMYVKQQKECDRKIQALISYPLLSTTKWFLLNYIKPQNLDKQNSQRVLTALAIDVVIEKSLKNKKLLKASLLLAFVAKVALVCSIEKAQQLVTGIVHAAWTQSETRQAVLANNIQARNLTNHEEIARATAALDLDMYFRIASLNNLGTSVASFAMIMRALHTT